MHAESEAERLRRIVMETKRSLRVECEFLDANDWPDELHPSDVIEKYLARAAHSEIARLQRKVLELGGSLS